MGERTPFNVLKFLSALLISGFGLGWSFFSLLRLGMWRHGRLDWGFLHLDWVLQPDLPYWGAHMANLGSLAFGLICIVWGLSRFYRTPSRWWSDRNAARELGPRTRR